MLCVQAITERWIAPIANSPKPPPERITMTLPVINSAKEVIIVAAGEGKVRGGNTGTLLLPRSRVERRMLHQMISLDDPCKAK